MRNWVKRGSSWVEEDKYYSHSIPASSSKNLLPNSGTYAELAFVPCLVLLGVPGSGKTTEFTSARQYSSDDVTTYFLSLGQVNSFEYLLNFLTETTAVPDSSSRVVFFFDALDESPASVLVTEQWLTSIISQGKKIFGKLGKQFFVRVSCRTADWLDRFETDLASIWGPDEVGIYELPPLKKEEVQSLAKSSQVDTEEFLKTISKISCEPLAARPVTLNMLLSIFKQNQSLPSNRIAIYQQGLLALFEESNTDRRHVNNTGRIDAPSRFQLAAKLAAVCQLSNKSLIWDGPYSLVTPEGAIKLDQLITTEKVDPKTYRNFLLETLRTGVFTKVAQDTYAWTHQTFAEFLAAFYLNLKTRDTQEINSFLLSQIPDNNFVIPQLREVAGWISHFNHDYFEYLVGTEPELLLSSDAAIHSDEDKFRLTEALLRNLNLGVMYDKYEWRSKYVNLNHPELSAQLMSVLEDKSKSIFARRASIQIAQSCSLKDLNPLLQRIIFDPNEADQLRLTALRGLISLDLSEYAQSLIPLLQDESLQDADDEIKGTLLEALWPAHLTPTQLFESLTLPKNPSLIGHYSFFLHEIDFESLDQHGAAEAINWLMKLEALLPEHHFSEIFNRLLIAIWKHIDHPLIRKKLSEFVVASADLVPNGHLEHQSTFSKAYAADSVERRKAFIEEVLASAPPNWINVYRIYFAPWPLVFPSDVSWLLENFFQGTNQSTKQYYQELILSLIQWEDTKNWETLLDASDNDPVLAEALAQRTVVSLESETAKWRRQEYQRKAESKSNKERVDLQALTSSHIKKTDESIEHWWELNLALLSSVEYPHSIEDHTGILTTGIWKSLPPSTQAQIINFAKRYLQEYRLDTDSHLEPNTFSRPSAAAYRAFRLLYEYDPPSYKGLNKSTWLKWFESLLTFNSNDPKEEKAIQSEILQTAYSYCPSEFRNKLRIVIPRKRNLRDVISLTEDWLDSELIEILWDIFITSEEKRENSDFFWNFFIHKSHLPAVAEALVTLEKGLNQEYIFSNDDIGKILALVETKTELFFEKFEMLSQTNKPSFDKLLPRVADDLNVTEFVKNNPKNPQFLARLYLWVQQHLDSKHDFEARSYHRDNLSFFLSRAADRLIGLGTQEAVEAIAWLSRTLPEKVWLKWSLNDAKANQRKALHAWRQPNEILLELEKTEAEESIEGINIELPATYAGTIDESFSVEDVAPDDVDLVKGKTLKILTVATEWFSKEGGITTLNRNLCQQLAKLGHEVYCFIPTATPEEVAHALAAQVKIVTSNSTPGLTDKDLLIAGPCLTYQVAPELVIGHSHVTGPQALRLAKHVYNCRYAHFVHTLALELEAYKSSNQHKYGSAAKGLQKNTLQKEICLQADLIVAIGPAVFDDIRTELKMFKDSKTIIRMDPGLEPDLFSINGKSTPDFPPDIRCYMTGRMKDENVKGVDIAALVAQECFKNDSSTHYKFMLRGYEEEKIDDSLDELREKLGITTPHIFPLQYSTNPEDLLADLCSASLVMMPSKCEAFGLVGLEAISAGVPTLISKASGLGKLLHEISETKSLLTPSSKEYVAKIVLDTHEQSKAVLKWSAGVQDLMSDRENAFRKAYQLREELKAILTWEAAIAEFHNALLSAKQS